MASKIFLRNGDTVALHFTVDAREIVAAGGGAPYTGQVRIVRNGLPSIHLANAETAALVGSASQNAQLDPNAAGLS